LSAREPRRTALADTILKAYLDNNIVSAIATDDTPAESEALNRLLKAMDEGKVELITSEVTEREIKAYQNELKRRLVERTYLLLAKVPIIRWDELAGMKSFGDNRTWINTPIIQNDPDYEALLKIGLGRERRGKPQGVDAQHVFVAVKQACDVFLTCDGAILHHDRASAIKNRFGVAVQKPSVFVTSQGW
jgi:hypothetical protein